MDNTRGRLLIACLHDVSPRDFTRIEEIDQFYEEVGVRANYAMLVVPNFWGQWALDKHPRFVDWLKARSAAGVEIFLHGYYHEDTTPHRKRSPMTRLKHAVLGEGEFADISEADALQRLRSGRKLLSDLLEKEVDYFVAPAWQYSQGARAALTDLGFSIAESRAAVWNPSSGKVLSNTPVIAYSNRTAVRRNVSIVWSQLSSSLMNTCDVIRHALHPGDFGNMALKQEIRRCLCELLSYREAASYQRLLEWRPLC